jgi:phosphoglucosamine mutase
VPARFGTDGIRGDADGVLTSDLVVALGRAAARVLGADQPFLIGRDTRASGERIRDDLVRGLETEGASALDAGVIPTPGVAFLAADDGLAAAMISASHNPWTDNGIKLFAPGGLKLDDDAQARIESVLDALAGDGAHSSEPPESAAVVDDALLRYGGHLVGVLEGRRLDGMRVVVDAANGAASHIGPTVLRTLGAQVVVIHGEPNGRNINDACGSTAPDDLCRAVVAAGADAGLAFDGDADRVLAVDEHGAIVDGDQIMVAIATDLHERGRLRNEAVAVTVMSNLGLRHALTDAGIGVVTTPVGDRSILEALREHGLSVGGEQSGHIVLGDHATTGDGILTGLVLLDGAARRGVGLSNLAARMVRYPQVLVNVAVAPGADLAHADAVWQAVRDAERTLGDDGRVLVRASGTEPVVRIMVEADTTERADAVAARLVEAVQLHLGSGQVPAS